MPIHTSIDSKTKIVHACYEGQFSSEELLDYFTHTWGAEQLSSYSELLDARNMNIADTPFTSLLFIAKSSTKSFYDNPMTKKAIVVDSDQQQSFFDFYQSARSLLSIPTSTIKVFRNIDDAKKWLGPGD